MPSKMMEVKVSIKQRHRKVDVPLRPNEKNASPRLPHEEDESPESQQSAPRKIMQQAFDDIEAGQLDTDRRGIPGVEEVQRAQPETKREEIPASARTPPSVPKE